MSDDFQGSTASLGRISANGSATGVIETNADQDWFRVYVTAGNYRIKLRGASTGGGSLIDPYLYVYNENGSLILSDDDGGERLDSLISTYLPTGYYYLSAGAWQGNSGITGSYTLEFLTENRLPHANPDNLPVIAEDSAAFSIAAADLLRNDVDADGDTLSISSVISGAGGSVTLNQNGTLTFTPAPNYSGNASFSYIATDGSGFSAATNVSFNIEEVDDRPTLGGDGAINIQRGGSATISTSDLTAADPDTAPKDLIFTVDQISHGDILVNGSRATSFSLADVTGGRVVFRNDGTLNSGSFRAVVSDGTWTTLTSKTVNAQLDLNSYVISSLTTQKDTILPSAADQIVRGTDLTLGNDYLDGGSGYDVLSVSYTANRSGAVALPLLANLSGFEEIQLINLTNATSTLVMPRDIDLTVSLTGGFNGSVYGQGAIWVQLNTGVAKIYGGNEQNQVWVTSPSRFRSGNLFDGGGGGSDALVLGYDSLSAGSSAPYPDTFYKLSDITLRNVEIMFVNGGGVAYNNARTVVQVTGDSISSLSQIGLNQNAVLSTPSAEIDFTSMWSLNSADQTGYIFSTNTDGTVFKVNDDVAALLIKGGPGLDTVVARNALSGDQRAQIFSGSVEKIIDRNGTYIKQGSGFTAKDYSVETIDVSVDLAGPGLDNARTGTGNDRIFGNANRNAIDAGAGNDVLIGGAGADTMVGGSGDDIYGIDDAGDVITELSGSSGGFDTVYSSITYTLPENVDAMFLVEGSGPINGTGNAGGNALIGNSSANVLRGLGGDDLYGVDGNGDTVVEAANGGYDEVYSSGNYTMADNTETLFLTGSAVHATGNSGNNAIIGNDLDNIIDTGAGTFEFINGLGGNDLLIGGTGHNEINGGAGNDIFRFTSPSGAADFFYDFTPGQDKIQLNAAAFGIGTASNPLVTGVSFIEGANVTSHVPTVLYNKDSGYLFYDADGTGAASPTVLALLNGTPTLRATDFLFY